MKSFRVDGFTIIETMLFLGISGLLIMGVLVGTGVSINIQRYRDSVVSLKSVIQQQYNEVANPINARSNNFQCDASGISVGSSSKGQTNCVLLGRYIKKDTSSGSQLMIKKVIGYYDDQLAPPVGTDIEVLNQYNVKVTDIDQEVYEIDWGASVSSPNTFNILIVKSPESGLVKTFISTNVLNDNNITNIINQANLGTSLNVCVNSNGMFAGNPMSVNIHSGAASASSVETLGENSGC